MGAPGARGGFSTQLLQYNQFEYPVRGDRPSLAVLLDRGTQAARIQNAMPGEDEHDVPLNDLRNFDRGAQTRSSDNARVKK